MVMVVVRGSGLRTLPVPRRREDTRRRGSGEECVRRRDVRKRGRKKRIEAEAARIRRRSQEQAGLGGAHSVAGQGAEDARMSDARAVTRAVKVGSSAGPEHYAEQRAKERAVRVSNTKRRRRQHNSCSDA